MPQRPKCSKLLDDPRLAAFRDLVGGPSPQTVVIEGELAVRRAIEAGAPVRTILATPAHAERIGRTGATLITADNATLREVTGFAFHRGVLAEMPRPSSGFDASVLPAARSTVVVAAGLADPANVGALIRTARAFAVDLVITDADPFTRKAIRASAGLVFSQAVWHVAEIEHALDALAGRTTIVACTPDSSATPLPAFERPDHITVVLGNEGTGLPPALLARADATVRIPLAPGIDSLNVAAAAAIVIWSLGSR